MRKIKYLIKRVVNMNFSNFFNYINKTHHRSNKNKIYLFLDIMYCGLKYQAGYMDYYLFEMETMNKAQRETVITRGKNNSIITFFNDKSQFSTFLNKPKFNKTFDQFINRDWIFITNESFTEFEDFIKNKQYVVAKPTDGTCGKGIEIIDLNLWEKNKLFNYLINNKITLLEEKILQDDKVNEVYPNSINTIRIITLCNKKNEKSTVFAAYFRIGNNNKIVDNFNSGGMVVPINVEDGKIIYPALDKDGNLYKSHPLTNKNIVGYTIPKWNEVKKLAKELAQMETKVGIVGWDIAITKDGLDVVEGNEFPGHDIYQLPPHRTNNVGMLPRFEEAINEIGLTKKDIF